MKRLVFTEHAIARLRCRRIERDMIISVVNNPSFIVVRDDETEAYREFSKGLLKVVYTEKERFIIIITVYWVDGDEAKDNI